LSQHERQREKFMGRALRTERYRFVAWFEKKSGQIVERELYDHQVDPLETRNLAREPTRSKIVQRLESRLLNEFKLH